MQESKVTKEPTIQEVHTAQLQQQLQQEQETAPVAKDYEIEYKQKEPKIESNKKQHAYFSKQSLKHHVKLQHSNDQQSTLPKIQMSSRVRLKSNESQVSSISVSALYRNHHIHYLFHNFCKQIYKVGRNRTFDQIAENAGKMPINKWMIFCREFDLTKKLNRKQAIQVFHQATNFAPDMTYDTFIRGLEIVKQMKKIQEKELVKEILHADSHYSALQKLSSLKTEFNGPKVNFLDNCRYKEEEKKVEKFYKSSKKQREYILHQGMSPEHIKQQILKRKQIRALRKQNLSGKNYGHTSQTSKKQYLSQKREITNESRIKRESFFSSYKNIFKSRKKGLTSTPGTTQQTSLVRQNKSQLHTVSTTIKTHENAHSSGKKIDSSGDYNLSALTKNIGEEKIIEVHEWNIDSDAESDQILKQHYQHEKTTKRKISRARKQTQQERNNNGADTREPPHRRTPVQEDQTSILITQYN